MFLENIKNQWFSNLKGDLLSGIVVALALIPEAIAFSIIAGVDPKVGLYASFCIAVVIAFTGGRPGMISAATGAMAVVMVTLVRDFGLEYLFAATLLTGVIQIVAGFLRLGYLLKFVSRAVMVGFVNALAILIFMAQLPELIGVNSITYVMVGAALAIIYLFPYVSKAVPAPLVAIIAVTAVSMTFGLDLRLVGDMGNLPDSMPFFLFPDVPFNLETLQIIFPYSLTLAAVGLLESLMTAAIVDEMTDTNSCKNRECVGQGVANIVSGFFGGMAGCAMIGQSVINVKSGGRGRLSALVAGLFLMFLIIVLADYVRLIPMAALVAVMIMVSISTFDWSSITQVKSNPVSSTIIAIATVLVVVNTHDLAKGVLVGVLLNCIFFAYKIAKVLQVTKDDSSDFEDIYTVSGQVFFASASELNNAFNFKTPKSKVAIDVTNASFWDCSATSVLDDAIAKFEEKGIEVELIQKANDTSVTTQMETNSVSG